MTATAWFRLLVDNRFRCSPSRWYLVVLVSVASICNSALALLQRALFGRSIERVTIDEGPVFILGHWRSGTTLLHKLLALDSRHACASTYACFAPGHFLVSRMLFAPLLQLLAPQRRSQDDVQVHLDDPQEDEWAVCCLGLPTPYRTAAFPNELPHASRYFDCKGLSQVEYTRWKRGWIRFLKAVLWRNPGKRLVLKSPLHTARLEVLLSTFPDARFVHLVRDPYEVYPSTLRLWHRLSEDEGLQVPKDQGQFDEFVLGSYERMYCSFNKNLHRIGAGRLCEVRYEELINDPVGTVREIYERLALGEFASVQSQVEAHAAKQASFQTNRFELSHQASEKINRRWRHLSPGFHRDVRRRAG
jgi:hypothetical protein